MTMNFYCYSNQDAPVLATRDTDQVITFDNFGLKASTGGNYGAQFHSKSDGLTPNYDNPVTTSNSRIIKEIKPEKDDNSIRIQFNDNFEYNEEITVNFLANGQPASLRLRVWND